MNKIMQVVLIYAGIGLGLMIASNNPKASNFYIGLIIAISSLFPLFILERKEKRKSKNKKNLNNSIKNTLVFESAFHIGLKTCIKKILNLKNLMILQYFGDM
jgi:hypothetical protein